MQGGDFNRLALNRLAIFLLTFAGIGIITFLGLVGFMTYHLLWAVIAYIGG